MDTVAKKDVIIPLVPAALSALLLAGGVTVFSACEQRADGSWMHCHQCQNMVAGSAVGLIALYGASSLVKNKPARLALLALAVIASVVVFFIPGGICPLCAMKTMRCHTVFQPFVRIMSVLVAGSGIGALVASWKKDAKPSA
ncbi:DUF4418 family protein [Pauljensenia sp. UMB0018B]|jgi:hypothetical protein|uniref:DUF4418 domain-containing protein n=3 Tax=Schaalia TaxID=2529408 RepID=A0A2I1I011_9ACTO|nr:DUF4418 family protein [Schaalia odontolytica]EDN81138.1 hypothetical protein ACTODO_01601 [Schaalia odontolytica ATCC 17982]EFF79335.1 hypothetical protein HMPREF0970_01740 [Schaalia odontolytica F0309]MBF0960187.1 DUF4418 family protein [Actinomyces sp.]MDK7339338.1 DUF4418 family protein [Pauljensenia sp. UMB0018B]MBS4938645.1 DUF4418 family protein [Actinomyces sp.]